uniref:Uncharacterized protein n=1 Tax=Oryza punctata TaxID=4537 RepID=A0A0E0LJE7_ORYPU
MQKISLHIKISALTKDLRHNSKIPDPRNPANQRKCSQCNRCCFSILQNQKTRVTKQISQDDVLQTPLRTNQSNYMFSMHAIQEMRYSPTNKTSITITGNSPEEILQILKKSYTPVANISDLKKGTPHMHPTLNE